MKMSRAKNGVAVSVLVWSLMMGGATAFGGSAYSNFDMIVPSSHGITSTAPQTKATRGATGDGYMSHNYPNNPDKSVRMYDSTTGQAGPWYDGVNAGEDFILHSNSTFLAGHSVRLQVRSSLWTTYNTTVKGNWRSQ